MSEIIYNKRYSYAGLCRVFGLEKLDGWSKENQLKKLSKEYDIVKRKDGSYVIKRKYNPNEIYNNKTYGKNKKLIEPIIYTILSLSPSNVIQFNVRSMLETLAMVNENYFHAKWHIEKSDRLITSSSYGELSKFITETEPMLRRALRDVLKQMEEAQLIAVTEIPFFAKKYKDENGNTFTKTYQVDDETEYPELLRAKQLAMDKIGVKRWSDMNFFEHRDAKHYIEDYLKETLNVDYYYYEYKVVLNKRGLNELMVEGIDDIREQLNKSIQEKIMNSKRKGLQNVEYDNKVMYIQSLIDIHTDLNLKKELEGVED